MKRIFSAILISSSLLLKLIGQSSVGSWTDHLAYSSSKSVAVGSKEIYSSNGASILVFNKEYNELRKLTKIEGLTECGISTLGWSEENQTLIIAYSSTNIDLIKNNVVYNISDILRKYLPGKKEIYRIRTNGKFAYLACSFGIVIIDLVKREINDTWKPGQGSETLEIFDIAIGNNKVYAATAKGVYYADISNPGLAYFGNWTIISGLPSPIGKYTSIVNSGNTFYANLSIPYSSADIVYSIGQNISVFSSIQGTFNLTFDPAQNGFTIASPSSIRYFNSDGALQKTITSYSQGMSSPNIIQAVADNSDLWISDSGTGLIRYKNMSEFINLVLPGPLSNNAYSISSLNGKTIISGGGGDIAWNNLGKPFEISIFENNKWSVRSSSTIIDPMRSFIDPANNDHFFVSTWGNGLLEYNGESLKQYTYTNSPIQTIIPGRPYARICGMAMDKNRNLWFTQSEVAGTVKALKPDGTWIVNPVTANAITVGDLIITKTGVKWIILPRGAGLLVLDDNNTPEIFSDDRSKQMLVESTENEVVSYVYSIAEDLDGNIWVGTNAGPFIYYTPENIFNGVKANRIKIPKNDGSNYADILLKSEAITTIAIDGANRKWLGTSGSGAYLLSSDGHTLLKNFNEQNSPLNSNSIVSLSVDNKTGDVWFGTSKGVQSYRGDAKSGNQEFSKVYSFPNPVRKDFTGSVSITGLMKDTQIRITDVSGNLVYKTVSNGGMATWDLKTYNGLRVTTGVYIVFCASSDGMSTAITKILVVGN
jgi:ligand-binding sensor domain-containing protein